MQLISCSSAMCQHARGGSHIAAQLPLRDATLATAASLLVTLEFPLQELLVFSYLILQQAHIGPAGSTSRLGVLRRRQSKGYKSTLALKRGEILGVLCKLPDMRTILYSSRAHSKM